MWISLKRYDELLAEVKVADRVKSEAEKQSAYAEARWASAQVEIEKLEKQLEITKQERKEMLDDLLIASGVKMSKYQEALVEKQLQETDNQPSFTGQTRQWAAQRTQEGLMTDAEKNKRAIEIVAELEREAALNIGGLGNV